jgi:hypothetical protein
MSGGASGPYRPGLKPYTRFSPTVAMVAQLAHEVVCQTNETAPEEWTCCVGYCNQVIIMKVRPSLGNGARSRAVSSGPELAALATPDGKNGLQRATLGRSRAALSTVSHGRRHEKRARCSAAIGTAQCCAKD